MPQNLARYECYCGSPVVLGSRFCPDCARHAPGMRQHVAVRPLLDPELVRKVEALRRTSIHAVASFLLGLAAWFALPFFGALFAVWAGHRGLEEIRGSRGATTGRDLAVAGLVLGYGQLALIAAGLLLLGGLALRSLAGG